MNAEDLDERFKDPDDPLRLVFVCAMWMTGFDAPSCSTIYLDRPMRNHTLMQTIARANRVFPEKENGLIVDYIGVFRNLEKALAIYGAATGDERVDSPHPATSRRCVAALDGARSSVRRALRALRRRPRRAAGGRRLRVHRAARRRRRGAARRRRDRGALPRTLRRGAREAVQGDAARPGRRGSAARRSRVIRVLAETIRSTSDPARRTSQRRLRRGRGAARPLGRGGGVRDPRRGRGRRRRSADRPQRRSTSTPWRRGSPAASAPRPSASPRCSATRVDAARAAEPDPARARRADRGG